MQQPDRTHACNKNAQHMDLLIELELNIGLANGQKENLITQKNKSSVPVLYSASEAHSCFVHNVAVPTSTGDVSTFDSGSVFWMLCESRRLMCCAQRGVQTFVQSLTFHCTSKVGKKVHAADRSCHLLL